MDNPERKGEHGFTLLEVIIAVTILTVGLLGMAALQATAIRGNAFSIRNTEAVALIEDKIEEYKNTAYASIAEGTVTETGVGSFGMFTRKSTIQEHVPVTDTKTITVRVSWTDPGSHSFSYQTVISK